MTKIRFIFQTASVTLTKRLVTILKKPLMIIVPYSAVGQPIRVENFHFSPVIHQSQSRYGLETRPASLFYLFVRVYADLCTVKTMNFWYNEVIVQ